MAGVSAYERSLIDAVLGVAVPAPVLPSASTSMPAPAPAPAAAAPAARIETGLALVLIPLIDWREQVLRVAVEPALRANHLNVRGVRVVFDDETPLPIAADWVGRAEVIIADVSQLNAAVLYVLGLCHGLRRCPLMIARAPVELPFDLGALRCLRYRTDRESLIDLRNNLTRALRIFLAAARHGGDSASDEGEHVA